MTPRKRLELLLSIEYPTEMRLIRRFADANRDTKLIPAMMWDLTLRMAKTSASPAITMARRALRAKP